MGSQITKEQLEGALGIYERVEDMKRDFPNFDLSLIKIEPTEQVERNEWRAGQPFHRWILTRSDFLAWRGFFMTTRLQCHVCKHKQRVPGTWDERCDAWDCPITPAMKKADDCPKWAFDFDHGDVPY